MPTAYLLHNFNVARLDRATPASAPSDLAVLRAYPNNYSLSPVIPSLCSRTALNGAQRSEESPLRWPDSSASPQNDKG